ncbi:MAG: hypothetical protein QF704_11270, partial [Anaerolineales bacterium]|nr:hypothetical protein [Anaerolineales bacterium]
MKKILLGILVLTTAISFAGEKNVLVKQSSQIEGIDNSPSIPTNNREQIIIQEIDFEGDVSGWTMESGWELSTGDSHSPTHSI